jgi:hypothetical protein
MTFTVYGFCSNKPRESSYRLASGSANSPSAPGAIAAAIASSSPEKPSPYSFQYSFVGCRPLLSKNEVVVRASIEARPKHASSSLISLRKLDTRQYRTGRSDVSARNPYPSSNGGHVKIEATDCKWNTHRKVQNPFPFIENLPATEPAASFREHRG